MVSLTAVRSSNTNLTQLPPRLVAVFAGATGGIGLSTLRQLAQHALNPKVYFLGRNATAGAQIAAELAQTCPGGEFIFIQADLALLKTVDEVCDRIIREERVVNLLFLTAGVIGLDKSDTPEGLEKYAAVGLYSRIRLMSNLLPLLQRASSSQPAAAGASPGLHLARIINIFAGSKGGACNPSDLGGRTVSPLSHRTATCTMTTLAMETLAARAPEVSFVHVYPGFVRTANQDMPGLFFVVVRTLMWVLGRWICVDLGESGERGLFSATSKRFAPAAGEAGVELPQGVQVAKAGEGGVFLVDWKGDEMPENPVLVEYRGNGMREKIWTHFEEEFARICGVSRGDS